MIRSTKNATTETIHRDGIKGQSIELSRGSLDGIADEAIAELTEEEYLANNAANPANTMSIVPSDGHWPQ